MGSGRMVLCMLRNSDGEVCLAASLHCCFGLGIKFSKAMGVKRGLILALEHGYRPLWVESDSEGVVRALNGQAMLIQDIRSMILEFISVSFSHVYGMQIR